MEGNSNDAVSSNNGTDNVITYGSSYGKIMQGAIASGVTVTNGIYNTFVLNLENVTGPALVHSGVYDVVDVVRTRMRKIIMQRLNPNHHVN